MTLATELRDLLSFSVIGGISVLLLSIFGLLPIKPLHALSFWAITFLALYVVHILGVIASKAFSKRWAPTRNCLIVGSGPRAMTLFRLLEASSDVRYQVLGLIDERGTHAAEHGPSVIGRLADLRPILKDHAVDEVFLALPIRSCYNQIQTAIHVCEEAGVECKLGSDLFSCSLAKLKVEDHEAHPMLAMKVARHDSTHWIKLAVDFAGAAMALLVCGIPMLLIGIAIRLSSPGSAIFTQYRYGLNKRMFKMYKFRTMRANAEQMQDALEPLNEMGGPVFKIRNDPRITPLGRLLRKTSLDELPQLWNVLRGDMSLVGPRPLPLRDVSRFPEASLMRRFSMKPGLTCLWQISGRSETSFERWMELDLRYIDDWSLKLDLQIIAKTIPVVFRGQGAV